MIGREARFLLGSALVYGFGTVTSRIVSLVMLPIYTRRLLPADYGTLETIDVSNGIIGFVVTLGIARALSRFYYESSEERERRSVVSTTYFTYVMIGLPAVCVSLLVSSPLSRLLLGSSEAAPLFRIGFLSLIFGGLVDMALMYVRLLKRPRIFISITLSRLLLVTALNIYFVVLRDQGVFGILVSSLLTDALYGLLSAAAVLRRTGMGFSAGLSLQMIRFCAPLVPANLGNLVVKQSDKYFVLGLLSVGDLGIYGLSLKMGNIVHNFLTMPFNMAFIPRRFEIMKREDAAFVFSRVFTYYIFVMGFFGLCLSALIPEALQLLVTPKYYRAADIVPLVVLSMIVFGTHYHFDFGILQAKQTRYISYISVAAACLQITLNWALIGKLGFFGAVWSSIASLTLQAYLLYHLSQRFYPIPYQFRRIAKYAALVVLWYGMTAAAQRLPLAFALMLKVMILLAFPPALVLLGVVTSHEVAGLRAAVALRLRPAQSMNSDGPRE